jgi:hypothetical protein
MRLLTLSLLLLPIALATTRPSAAQSEPNDWRFCVAADYRQHVAYLTPPFESAAAGKDLESRVAALLDRESRPYQNVQCRLGAVLPESVIERSDAEAFIKALGFRLLDLN